MTNVFFLGATGYIGGTIFEKIYQAHPDLKYTLLVRSTEKAQKIASEHKNVHLVKGDLDSDDILSEEAERADIVITAADSDHLGHIQSIYKGLSKRSNPAYILHISGTAGLSDQENLKSGFAHQSEISDKYWDDIADIKTITSFPDEYLHRRIDREVLDAAPKNVKQIVVAPPCIYGSGTGLINRKSVHIPKLIREIQRQGHGFTINGFNNSWCFVHVADLGDLLNLLFTEALKPNGGNASWGREGYYFAVKEPVVWGDIAKDLTLKMHKKGILKSDDIETFEKEEDIKKLDDWVVKYVGCNSRSTSKRAKRDVGWEPKEIGVFDTLDETIDMVMAG